MTPTPLEVARLRWRCDCASLGFETTNDLPDLEEILGQARAIEALQFGIAIRREGYNLYVLGPSGVGKRSAVLKALTTRSASEPTPSDWIYVNNFSDLRKPRAISLPAGRGVKFRDAMETLVDDLETAIPAALESDEHKTRLQEIEREANGRQSTAFQQLAKKAFEQNIQLIRTPGGFALAPLKNGEVLSPDEYQKLPEEERTKIQKTVAELQEKLQAIIELVPKWSKEARDKVKELNREAARLAIGHLVAQVQQQYTDLPDVVAYLQEVENDVLERVDEFQPSEEPQIPMLVRGNSKPSLEDYEVNLLVDHSATRGAPVVYEDNPSHHALMGRVEHESHMGALMTDFTLIKGGALHRASGGYLILDALKMLQQPMAWEGLKRALKSRQIRIESLGEMLSLISTVSLEPEPIPLDVKVVLIGDRMLYYLLFEWDPDFAELFKVSADFDEEIERSPENTLLYARFIATLARREKLRPLDRGAVAAVLEHAARIADDSERLSTHMRTVADVLREADHWAGQAGATVLAAQHVRQAVDSQIRRADRVRERIHEEIRRGTILVETSGEKIAQVNGLSVIDMGTLRFGQPSRITATARLGRGEVLDIEREVKLGGPFHSKGVLILSSFIASRYANEQPLPISASLVFEQSYGMVDGDSASVAELTVLLSAIARIPIKQDFAVTGSIDQLGNVQPIGGVNEKIEGFFDVCRAAGLTGRQGVIIPSTNVKHLMLRDDVVEACREGRFAIYSASTVDQAFELLTGLLAGERDSRGEYPAESVNGRVLARIRELVQLRARFGAEAKADGKSEAKSETQSEPIHE